MRLTLITTIAVLLAGCAAPPYVEIEDRYENDTSGIELDTRPSDFTVTENPDGSVTVSTPNGGMFF